MWTTLVIILSVFMLEGAESSFQNDSESLVVAKMVAEAIGDDIADSSFGLGFLKSDNNLDVDAYSLIYNDNLEGYHYESYMSQVGIQGHIFGKIVSIIPKMNKINLFRLICCCLLVIVLVLIIIQLHKRYGILFASIFGVVSFLSPWIVNFSRNLYWVEFTWFIPMLLCLLCINYEDKRKFIYPLFFIAIFIKCLCGYEYLSTIMMTGIMFLMVEWVCNKESRRNIFKTIFIVGICSLAGFLAAFIIHAFIYGSGDVLNGFKMLQAELVERRTFGSATNFDPAYAESLEASVLDVLVKYFWSTDGILGGKPMCFIFVITVIALMYQKFVLKEHNKFEVSLFIITLLTTISWFVLGKAHSYIHTHMNFVLFFMGWIQVSFYILCKTIIVKKNMRLMLKGEE